MKLLRTTLEELLGLFVDSRLEAVLVLAVLIAGWAIGHFTTSPLLGFSVGVALALVLVLCTLLDARGRRTSAGGSGSAES